MPPIPKRKLVKKQKQKLVKTNKCIACGGTGIASNGQLCVACMKQKGKI